MIEVHIKKDENKEKKSFFEENLSSILTSIVAVAAVLISIFQFLHSKKQADAQMSLSERSLKNDSSNNERDYIQNERDFIQKLKEYNDEKKQSLIKIILENEAKLLSKDPVVRQTFLNVLTGTYGEESSTIISILNNLSNSKYGSKDSVSLNNDIQLVKNNIENLKKQKIDQLYRPLIGRFQEGKVLYENYIKSNYSYKNAKEIYQNNKKMMELLVSKGSFIPDYLLADKQFLLEHLSLWTTAFEQQDSESKPSDVNATFRVKYSGRTFPQLSSQRFIDEYIKLGGSQ